MSKFIFTFFVLLSMMGYAQSPNEQINDFFQRYQSNKEGAVRHLMSNHAVSKVPEENLRQLLHEINKMDDQSVGAFKGYELITEKHVANSLITNSYLVKHELHPVRFTFTFYKAENDWKIFHFNFDTKLLEELLEASKLYYQNLNTL